MYGGKVVKSGGPELAKRLKKKAMNGLKKNLVLLNSHIPKLALRCSHKMMKLNIRSKIYFIK